MKGKSQKNSQCPDSTDNIFDTLKEIAKQTAALHSTNLGKAISEFYKTLEKEQPDFCAPKQFEDRKKQFLNLLPKYRHPAPDVTEKIMFYGYVVASADGDCITHPNFITAISKSDIDRESLNEIRQYLTDAEQTKLALKKCQEEKDELKDLLDKAQQAWKEGKNRRSSERNKMVVQALGLSTGKAPKRLNLRQIWMDYVDCIRKKGMSRKDATNEVKKKHGLPSFDRTLRILTDYRKEEIYDKIKESSLKILEEIRKNLEGIIRPKDR